MTQKKLNIVKAISIFVALLLSTLSLLGCTPQKNTVKDKIEIISKEEIPKYKDSTKQTAKDSVYSLLYLYKESTSEKITSEDKANMQRLSQAVVNGTESIIDEEKYLLIFEKIDEYSSKIVEGVSQIKASEILDGMNTIKPVYKEISNLGGKKLVGEIIYSLAMCNFDIKYDKQMVAYEKYGESYILDKANDYLRAKEILENEIGISNINVLIEYGFVYAELFAGGALENDLLSEFSDEEILIFIKNLELEKITVGEKGWTMLFAIYGEGAVKSTSKSFFDRAMFSASQNGDVNELGRSTKELLPILAIAQKRLTISDVALLREGKTDAFLVSLISKLTDDEWDSLDKAMPKDFDHDKYVDLAKKHYGEDFSDYLSTYKTSNLEDLKSSQGTDNFYKTLKEYIAGICPAFSYGMDF